MRDPEETIKRMDEISVPNQWERIRSGVPRPKSGEPFTRRLLAGVVAACVALAGTILVVKAFDGPFGDGQGVLEPDGPPAELGTGLGSQPDVGEGVLHRRLRLRGGRRPPPGSATGARDESACEQGPLALLERRPEGQDRGTELDTNTADRRSS